MVPGNHDRHGCMEELRLWNNRIPGGADGNQPRAIRGGPHRRRQPLAADLACDIAGDDSHYCPDDHPKPWKCAECGL